MLLHLRLPTHTGNARQATSRAILSLRGTRRRAVLGALLGTTLLLPATLLPTAHAAQYQRNPPRTITGTVTDGGHEPLRGAVVQIETEGSMSIQSFVTDERGIYHFRNLSPDSDYQVWATFRGIHSKHENISKFDHKLDRTIPLKIELAK